MAAIIAASGSALAPSICPTMMPIADAVAEKKEIDPSLLDLVDTLAG